MSHDTKRICCKSKGNNFCSKTINLSDNSFIEHDGKNYCLFHAPNINSYELENSYQVLLEKLISGDIYASNGFFDVFFPEITITQPICFSDKVIKKSISFENCIFLEDVTFFKCTFEQNISFENAVFKKKVKIHYSKFISSDNQDSKSFISSVSFSSYKKLSLSFDGCYFENGIEIIDGYVNDTFSFQGVRADGLCYFISTYFNGISKFNGTEFRAYTDFKNSSFKEDADFRGCYFVDKVYFYIDYDRKSDDNPSAKPVDDVMFYKSVTFNYSTLNNAIFRCIGGRNLFKEFASFQSIDIDNKLIFENIDISQISFKNSSFDNISFIGHDLPDKLYDDGKILTSDMAEQYRKLKQKFIKDGNHVEAGKWHYKEKEKQAEMETNSEIKKLAYGLYNFSSGFGENYLRSINGFLLILITTYIFIFYFAGLVFDKHGIKILLENLYHATNVIIAGNEVSLKTLNLEKNYVVLFFITIARLLLIVQFWMMSLALRNHFRR